MSERDLMNILWMVVGACIVMIGVGLGWWWGGRDD